MLKLQTSFLRGRYLHLMTGRLRTRSKRSRMVFKATAAVISAAAFGIFGNDPWCRSHPTPWSPLFVSRKTSIMQLDDDETIYDYYDFGRVLGEGGFSVVYHGKCKQTESAVAIKVVDKENSNLADVKNEIAIMVKTGIHPNIVSLHAAYDTEKAYILILDLVRGGEVFEHVVQKGTLSEKYACLLFKAVASAVQHMHNRGIVHNDLKPENLLLTTDSEDAYLKVTDFGESYFTDEYLEENSIDEEKMENSKDEEARTNNLEETSSFNDIRQFRTRRPRFRGGGTPAYMSPERVRRAGHSKADDMWAMGVCLFIMLCGSHPFDPNGSRSAISIADEIERGRYDTENPLWSSLSSSARDIISRLLERDISKRITSVDELLEHEWFEMSESTKESEEAQRLRVSRLAGFRVLALLRRSAIAMGVSAENMFDAFDITGDGYISVDELQEKLCMDLGQDFSRDQIEAAIAVLDTDHDQRLSLSEFQLLLERPLPVKTGIQNEHAKSLFRAIDKSKSGTIDYEELSHLAVLMGVDGSTVHELWHSLGKAPNETIDEEEFYKILNRSAEITRKSRRSTR